MLADAIKDFKEQRLLEVKRCIITEWAHSLSEDDQTAFEQVMIDYSISNRQLLKIFRNAGATFSLEALRKHRNEECQCR